MTQLVRSSTGAGVSTPRRGGGLLASRVDREARKEIAAICAASRVKEADTAARLERIRLATEHGQHVITDIWQTAVISAQICPVAETDLVAVTKAGAAATVTTIMDAGRS